MKVLNRRHAIRQLVSMFGAAPFLGAQQNGDPVLEPPNVMDFAPLAKAKLDPIAWDYLEGGSEDEVTLRDNRAAFDKTIIPSACAGGDEDCRPLARIVRPQAGLSDLARSGLREELLLCHARGPRSPRHYRRPARIRRGSQQFLTPLSLLRRHACW
jgi:hypothetical protein